MVRIKGRFERPTILPNSLHAGAYAATLHYLKTVRAMGVAEAKVSGQRTVAAMKGTPTDDDAFGQGMIRADGQMITPVHLFQVKTPEEAAAPTTCSSWSRRCRPIRRFVRWRMEAAR